MFSFVTIALIAAFSLFVLNALIMDYFMEASGPVKAEAGVIGSPTAVPGMDSNQHEKVFYGMALKSWRCFSLCLQLPYMSSEDGRHPGSRPAPIDCGWYPRHYADITMKDYISSQL